MGSGQGDDVITSVNTLADYGFMYCWYGPRVTKYH